MAKVLFLLIVFSLNAHAGVIFVASQYGAGRYLKAALQKNLLALADSCKKASVPFSTVVVTPEGRFREVNSNREFGDLFTALENVTENYKDVWIIFAGHTESPEVFLSTPCRNYTLRELESFLKRFRKHVRFLGFDTCNVGKVKSLKRFASYAEIVAGTGEEEMEWGWQGIYENFDKILKTSPEFVPVTLIYYYQKFNAEKITFFRKNIQKSGFSCVSMSVYAKGVLTAGVTCLN